MTAELQQGFVSFFEASLAVSLLIGLVLVVRGPVARRFGPKAAYALWLLPLVRLAMPPVPLPVSEPAEAAPVRVATATVETGMAAIDHPLIFFAPVKDAIETLDVVMLTAEIDALEAALAAPAPAPEPISAPASVAATSAPPAPDRTFLAQIDWGALASTLWMVLALVWLLVAVAVAGRMLLCQSLFADRVWRRTILADETTAREAAALGQTLRVRQPFTVRRCPAGSGPFVCGLVRPIVVVPEDFAERFSAEERRFALTHELLHVRRGDLFAILLMTAVRAAQWFNPLAPKAVAAFRADQEAACDATVLRELDCPKADYARTLLKAVMPQSGRGTPLPALTLDHGLKERLRIMNVRKTLRGGAMVVTGLAIAGLASTASYAVQEAPAPAREEIDRLLGTEVESAPAPTEESQTKEQRAERIRRHALQVQRRLAVIRRQSDAAAQRAELARQREAERAEARAARRARTAELDKRRAELEERRAELAERKVERAALAKEAAMARREAEMARGDRGPHRVFMAGGDSAVAIDSRDGIILLTSPMAGLEERLARLDDIDVDIPDIPEPPMPPEVTVVEIRTDKGEVIEVPDMTIMLPGKTIEIEAYADKVAAMVDALKIETRIESALGDDFGEQVKLRTQSLTKLVDSCKAEQSDLDGPRLLTSTEDGVTQKVLCFDPARTALDSEELATFVHEHKKLTDAEKERFDAAQHGHSYSFSFDWDD